MNTIALFILVIFAGFGVFSMGVVIAMVLYNRNQVFRDFCDTWAASKYNDQ